MKRSQKTEKKVASGQGRGQAVSSATSTTAGIEQAFIAKGAKVGKLTVQKPIKQTGAHVKVTHPTTTEDKREIIGTVSDKVGEVGVRQVIIDEGAEVQSVEFNEPVNQVGMKLTFS